MHLYGKRCAQIFDQQSTPTKDKLQTRNRYILKANGYPKVTGEWRRLHNKELYALCSAPNIIRVIKSRRMRWVGHLARMEERRGVNRVLMGKPEVKKPFGRTRRR
jgi:hypothetical protein